VNADTSFVVAPPSADQLAPSQRAIASAATPPALSKKPPT
jgi:hypothetical protein